VERKHALDSMGEAWGERRMAEAHRWAFGGTLRQEGAERQGLRVLLARRWGGAGLFVAQAWQKAFPRPRSATVPRCTCGAIT